MRYDAKCDDCDLLRTQVQALQQLSTLQEQELSSGPLNTAGFGAAAAAKMAGSNGCGQNCAMDQGVRLLSLWRNKVFELLVSAEAAKLHNERSLRSLNARAVAGERQAADRSLRLDALEAEHELSQRALTKALESQRRLSAQSQE